MPKKKNLNGIPGNIANQYFSTLNYYNGGYMSCWLYYIAKRENINEIEIDVLHNQVSPDIDGIKSIVSPLYKLRNIILVQLENNGFDDDFITKAILKFDINLDINVVYCNPLLEDIEGNVYKCKRTISESAYPINNLLIKNNQQSIIAKMLSFIKIF